MMGRSTGLGHRGMSMQFSSNDNVAVKNFIETHSCFNLLIFNVLVVLLTEILTSHKEFMSNLNFHGNSDLLLFIILLWEGFYFFSVHLFINHNRFLF